MLALRFGLSDRALRSKTALLAELEQKLTERRGQEETTVLIVDEAQSLPSELLEEIRLLANIETASDKLLTVILAGQPELGGLNQPSLRQLKQRVALRCELRPLSREETVSYVAGRIRIAGGIGSQIFTRDAVELMHVCARGIPRTISVLADNALVGGFAAGVRPVPSRFVREVSTDFDIGAPDPSSAAPRPATPPPAPLIDGASPPAAGSLLGQSTREPGTAVKPPPAESAVDAGVFGALAPKRKRFSFFWS
jgi:hypothetical protein